MKTVRADSIRVLIVEEIRRWVLDADAQRDQAPVRWQSDCGASLYIGRRRFARRRWDDAFGGRWCAGGEHQRADRGDCGLGAGSPHRVLDLVA